jgi:hypothetical protein
MVHAAAGKAPCHATGAGGANASPAAGSAAQPRNSLDAVPSHIPAPAGLQLGGKTQRIPMVLYSHMWHCAGQLAPLLEENKVHGQ